MPAVARQVALHIFVANADLRRLVALSDDMEPPVAVAIPAKVAHGRLPVIPAHQIRHAQVHGEERRQYEQGAFVDRILLGQFFRRLDHIVPLQAGEGAAGHFLGVALLIDTFLFDGAERIRLGQTLIHRILIEAAADGKHLRHRALGHFISAPSRHCGFVQVFVTLGRGLAEGAPGGIDLVSVVVAFQPAADS